MSNKIKELGDKKKKKRLQLEKNKAKGKEVLAMSKQTEQLHPIELEKFLLWHNAPKNQSGNKKDKLTKWKVKSDTQFKSTVSIFSTMGACQ